MLYCVRRCRGQEIDVGHGIVDVFAFQEALLIEAIFGIALLMMLWIGFRRWLQYKEKTSRLIAEQTAERDARYGAHMERVEARLKAIEEIVIDENAKTDAQIKALPTTSLTDPTSKRDKIQPNP